MSTKDNPGTLLINLYLTAEQPKSQPSDFGELIGEVHRETAATPTEGEGEGGQVIASSCLETCKLYLLKQDVLLPQKSKGDVL